MTVFFTSSGEFFCSPLLHEFIKIEHDIAKLRIEDERISDNMKIDVKLDGLKGENDEVVRLRLLKNTNL